ncbi:hypothetical protein [Actibacterium lipolyticum]|uniref:Uncharacterized protein n=1 Tax=Actibacterium lipolyticum TaxID=1524263 RepID=A0A238KQF9_9RHOB|nr:hypothetical protein [Actibacterium lipolyticum]SMX45025.1 hypothetical protein COL8621_02697 [Actibacterium lipolyticum]
MRRLALALLLPLAACATPREQCERTAKHDLNVVSALIVETEQNIARGYALETRVIERPNLTVCWAERPGDGQVGISFCNTSETRTVEEPVAINLDEERAKLKTLKVKFAELKTRTATALAICARQYPNA